MNKWYDEGLRCHKVHSLQAGSTLPARNLQGGYTEVITLLTGSQLIILVVGSYWERGKGEGHVIQKRISSGPDIQ